MSDPTSRTRFSSVFPKMAWVISCKTDLDPIWMAWSGFGQTHLGRKQAGVQKLIGLVCGKVQRARYQFATFRLSSVLPQTCRILSCQTSSDHIVSNQLRAKPARIISCQTSSDHIVPNQLGSYRVKPDPCQTSSDHIVSNQLGSYRVKPARIISCQTSSDHIVQNQPGSDLALVDCVRFWPNGSGPGAGRCARIIRPASGQRFRAYPDRIRIGSGVFNNISNNNILY